MSTHVFGIRHHGPGSAHSLRAALDDLRPDIILVEGPPDANQLVPLLAHRQMQPPVALLIYRPDQPQRAAFYPFATFSPEWQAIRYALEHGIPAEFGQKGFRIRRVAPGSEEAERQEQEKSTINFYRHCFVKNPEFVNTPDSF